MESNDKNVELHGSIWLTVDGEKFGGPDRVTLLAKIAEQGSITQAAKAIGMSYKAAWDAVDTMNNLAGRPLVERSSGGRGGGSTQLTARGLELIERFDKIDAIHRQFIHILSEEAIHFASEINLLKTINMKTSSRNQFSFTVTAIKNGVVNDEIELTNGESTRLVAIVTCESTESLGL